MLINARPPELKVLSMKLKTYSTYTKWDFMSSKVNLQENKCAARLKAIYYFLA